jgi:hypothetical protein
LRFVRPQPMLRAIPDARNVAAMLFKATQQVQVVAPIEVERQPTTNIPLIGAPA